MTELLVFICGSAAGALFMSLFLARSYSRGRRDGSKATLNSIYSERAKTRTVGHDDV